MDLYIDRDELIRGLSRVQGIVERRTTNIALSHVNSWSFSVSFHRFCGFKFDLTDAFMFFTSDSFNRRALVLLAIKGLRNKSLSHFKISDQFSILMCFYIIFCKN